MVTHFEATPNEVIISGGEDATLAAQRLVIADDGVRVVGRGGLLGGSREIHLAFDDVRAARYEEAVTYDLVVETADATYRITNVTGYEEEAERMVRFVVEQGAGGGSSAEATGAEAVSDGGDAAAEVESEGASERGAVDEETDVASTLREFARLRDDGVITAEEFERKKRDLLEDD